MMDGCETLEVEDRRQDLGHEDPRDLLIASVNQRVACCDESFAMTVCPAMLTAIKQNKKTTK